MNDALNHRNNLIEVTMLGQKHRVPIETSLFDFLEEHGGSDKQRYIAAIVANRLNGRSYPLRWDCEVQPVTNSDRAGWDVYRRSACLMFYEAVRRFDPALKFILSGTLGDGYFYSVRDRETLELGVISAIEQNMRAIQREDLPFIVKNMSVTEARKLLADAGYHDKVHLLATHWEPNVRVVWCGEFFDLFHNPVCYSSGEVRQFKLEPYSNGLVLRFPSRGSSEIRGPLKPRPKLFAIYQETRQWNEILGVSSIGVLNERILKGDIHRFIRVAEGFHEKKIAFIADEICKHPELRLVTIAGPSASGKTTFSKRLGVQLMVNGLKPMALSVDNFFVNRELTPLDEEGDHDFESIDALNLELLGEVLEGLLAGQQVLTPVFDFHLGRARPLTEWRPMELGPNQILILEGIHGLNERLTHTVPRKNKFKVYISALTQLCIDDHNRIFTSDTRLLRRLIRDRKYRGYSAADTIKRWPSVRRGENRNIFPFQEQADVLFNSALVYEHAVLKPQAERYLLEVPQDDPAFTEAYRLLRFLRLMLPLIEEEVPNNSLLREFIGNSAFSY